MKRQRGIDTTAPKKQGAEEEEEDYSLDKFAPAKDSKDVRFHEFVKKEMGENDSRPEPNKKKVPNEFKDLYALPESINYANYNQNQDVKDRKHWLTGLAEVSVNKSDKDKDSNKEKPVNEVVEILNADAKKDILDKQL